MSNTTVMRWLADGRSEWLDEQGRVQPGLPPLRPEQRLQVLVPGEDVLLLDLPALPGSSVQLAQAVPFAVEDLLAAPVETQHVAWTVAADRRVQVAVAERKRLQDWLAPLRALGWEPQSLQPDSLALAASSALREEGRLLLRVGGQPAMAIERASLDPLQSEWSLPDETVPVGPSPLPWLAERLRSAPLNLLQGEFAPPRRRDRLQSQRRWAGALALAALSLAFAASAVDYVKLAARVRAQEAEMTALYRRAVPGATSVEAPALQLQSVLAAAGGGSGERAVQLLDRVAPALRADPGLRLESLDYREGQLEIAVQAGDVAALDALRQRLQAAALPAEITASTPGSQGVQGRLRIGATP